MRETKVLYVTNMTKLPENCLECNVVLCRLPEQRNSDRLLKKYLKQRHENCPLFVTEVEYE